MPISRRRLNKLVGQAAGRQFEVLENRYQCVLTAYYQAQQQFCASQQEHVRLSLVVRAKQEVIELLLPYYPHPLTPELRYKINLS